MSGNLIKYSGLFVLILLASCGSDIDESPTQVVLVPEDASSDGNATLANNTGSDGVSNTDVIDLNANTPEIAIDAGETTGADTAANIAPEVLSDGGTESDAAATDVGTTASSEIDSAGTAAAGDTAAGIDGTETDTGGTDTGGTDTAGTATAGTTTTETTTTGTTTEGTATDGATTEGTDSAGTATAGDSGLTVIAVAVGDTAGVDVNVGTVDDGSTTAGSEYPAGSLASVIEAHGELGMALGALKTAGLDLALNDPRNQWTVFLPTDAAMERSPAFDIQKHIHTTAAIPAIELVLYGDQPLLMNDGESLFFRDGFDQFVTIAGSAEVGTELFGNTSSTIVHVIDTVIGVDNTPEYEYAAGSLADILERSGNMSKVMTALRADKIDDELDKAANKWTWFLPHDAGLSSPDDINLIAHIHKPTVLDSQALTGLSGSSITLKGGNEFEIGGGGTEPLTIGGYTILESDVYGTPPNGVVHIIDGVLVP